MSTNTDSDDLRGCRGIFLLLPFGVLSWAIVIAFVLWAYSAWGQEKDFTIEQTAQAVVDKIDAHDLVIAVKKAEIEDMPVNAGVASLDDLSDLVKRRCELPQPGVCEVHLEDIRTIDSDTGELVPISLKWEPVQDKTLGFVNKLNSAYSEISGNGMVRVVKGALDISYWPVSIVMNGKENAAKTDGATLKQSDVGRVEVLDTWPLGAVEWLDLKRGGVKESIVLPDIRDAIDPELDKTLTVRYGFKSVNELKIVAQEGEIFLRGSDDAILGIISAPAVRDAKGKITDAAISITDGFLSVSIDAAWLDSADRAYPVVIDPTVDSGQSTVYRSVRAGGVGTAYERFFMKFDLPAISGTCDTVALRMYLNSFINATSATFTVSAYTAGASVTTGWDASSTGATLNALTMFSTGISQVFAVGSSPALGNYSWTDIKGTTDVNSIKWAYDDGTSGVCDPGLITIQLRHTTGGTTAVTGTDYFSNGASGDEIQFAEPGTANGPFLRITYTGSLSCFGGKSGSGSAGMILGKL